MTDQSNSPVPPETGSATSGNGTLIERAVKTFDLTTFSPPPVPTDLAPPVIKPAARHRRAAEAKPQTVKPAAPAPVEALAEVAVPAPAAAPAEPAPEAPAPTVVFPSRKKRSTPAKTGQRLHPVDRQHLREQGMIVAEGSVTALLEEFRIVKRQVLLQAAELRRGGAGHAAQRVLICSPHPGEGKTWCAVNLALSIAAERESEVLLVDADFAKPSVLSALGLPGGPGLMDALASDDADVASFVIATDIPGLSVLPAGEATSSDSEYLNSSRTTDVLDRLTENAPHRLVIFDSPPVLAASPAAELAKHVGQALVVVRADSTGQGALEDAISLLSGCPNVQLLLNAVNFSPSGRRFGSYYGYRG